jgi:hypothetical protein
MKEAWQVPMPVAERVVRRGKYISASDKIPRSNSLNMWYLIWIQTRFGDGKAPEKVPSAAPMDDEGKAAAKV